MDISEMADLLDAKPQDVKRFLRSSTEFSVIEVDRLTDDSVEAIRPLFEVWFGFRPAPTEYSDPPSTNGHEPESEFTDPPIDDIIEDDGLLSISSLRRDGLYSPGQRQAVYEITNRQNAWLEKRLKELGRSLGGMKRNSRWITDDPYVTGKRRGTKS